ncbi:MAG TPA: Fe-S cluster assembly protein SufD [Acidimicrobiales bacterium]|nr:Fe-S cluster assembly protein SufD [Acidimicrobiales bacterium]
MRTIDGLVVATEPGFDPESVGLTVASARDRRRSPAAFGAVLAAAQDAFTLLAEGFAPDAVVVAVPPGVDVAGPIVVVHELRAHRGRVAVFPRTFVELGEGAHLTVVEHFVSPEGAALACPVTELEIAPQADLAYHSIQEFGRSAWQLGYLASRIGREGSLRSFAAAFGGGYARLCTHSTLAGEGATSELLAAYFGDGTQVQDMRTFQEHAAPRTRSNLIFKGAVDDAARSVYSGLIHIHKGARKSDASQTNRNLVLSDAAHADSVPNLDIEENDVRCSHASAVGPVDRAQRFYLESRGLPPEVAERLILLGFFDDLFARAPEPGVARYLRGVVAQRLSGANLAGTPEGLAR